MPGGTQRLNGEIKPPTPEAPTQGTWNQISYQHHREPDLSMAFVNDLFKRQIERPHKQVRAVVALWQKLLPPELLEHCRLESLRRGVLRVAVDSSGRLYELDRLLREGLGQELIRAQQGTAIRKIQLRVGKV